MNYRNFTQYPQMVFRCKNGHFFIVAYSDLQDREEEMFNKSIPNDKTVRCPICRGWVDGANASYKENAVEFFDE